MPELNQLFTAVVAGDAKTARAIAQEKLAAGLEPLRLVNDHLVPAMDEAGRRFGAGDYFVPELLLSARAMKSAMELIRPLLAARGDEPQGRVVIGTVRGDLHDIGKNLVAAMLEGGGFEVIDLGVNVPAEKFVASAHEQNAHIVAMSALLTTTMLAMKTTIDAFQQAALRSRVKILVGGAAVTQTFAQEIGADGYGADAVSAVALAKRVLAIQPAQASEDPPRKDATCIH